MSFTELRAAREKKETNSYVKASSLPESITTAEKIALETENEHQTDGINYTSLPRSIEVRASAVSGRGLFTKEYRKAGSILLSVRPHASVLSVPHLDSYCSSCVAPSPQNGLKRCTRCHAVYYCDATCQKTDWSIHKHECMALQNWAKAAPSPELALPSDAVRCLGRLCWMRKAKGVDSDWSKELDAMQSHRKNISPSSHEKYTHLAHALVRYLGLSSPAEIVAFGFASSEVFVDVISRFITNSFTLTSPSLSPLGVSVSPLVALINHSCDPNAVLVFPRSSKDTASNEPLMQVIAIKDITPDEEIFTAYIDTTLPRNLRQEALQDVQNFVCACTLCSDQGITDPREALACPKSCGGTCPIPTEENELVRCVKCGAVVPQIDAVLDALRVGQEALDKATSLQNTDPVRAQRITGNMIPILVSSWLVPSAHPLLALRRLHQYLLISSLQTGMTQDMLDETIIVAQGVLSGLSGILTKGHPVRAIELAELGKTLAVDEPAPADLSGDTSRPVPSGPARLKIALQTLHRAREELIIGFGAINEGGEVGRKVRESISSVEKELSVWKQGLRNVIEDTPGLRLSKGKG